MCYLVDEEALKRLNELVSADGFKLEWLVSLSDGSSLTCSDLTELLSIPNTQERRIERIRCRGDNTAEAKEISVTFRQPNLLNDAVIYEVAGDDKTVIYVSNKLQEFLLGQRQWYTVLKTTWKGFLFYILFALLFLFVLVIKHWLPRNIHPAYLETTIQIAVGIVPYVIYTKIINILYPISIFAIGKGKERYEALRKTREVFLVGFVLATLAAIVGGFIVG